MTQSTYVKGRDALWIKGTNYPAAPTIRISLHTADPDLTGANEIAFTRVAPSTYSAIATSGANRQFSISESLTFVSSPITGSATHWGVWDAASGGNFLGGGQFLNEGGSGAPFALTTGNDVTIAANTIYLAYRTGVFSNYFIDAKLNWFKGTTFPAAPTNIYAGLGTGLLADGTGTNSGLTRQIVPWGANVTVTGHIRVPSNAQVSFGVAGISYTLDSAAFYDAVTAGNLLWVGNFSSRVFGIGSTILWETGNINVEF